MLMRQVSRLYRPRIATNESRAKRPTIKSTQRGRLAQSRLAKPVGWELESLGTEVQAGVCLWIRKSAAPESKNVKDWQSRRPDPTRVRRQPINPSLHIRVRLMDAPDSRQERESDHIGQSIMAGTEAGRLAYGG